MDIMSVSKILSDTTSDYDQLDEKQLVEFYDVFYSFYLFKFMYAKKKKLEEVKNLFGFPAVKRPFWNLTNN